MTENLLLYILVVVVACAAGIFLCGRSGLDARADGWPSIIVGLIGVVLVVHALL